MKKILFIFFLCPFLLISSDVEEIRIIFTGDIQGYLKPEYATYMNPAFPPTIGNAGAFLNYLNKVRQHSNPILISNGNIYTDNAFTFREKREKVEKFLDDVNYDFINFGVFDVMMLDKDFKATANKYKIISSNATFNDFPIFQYRIIEYKGIKIGIFGLVSEYAKLYNQSKYWDKFNIENELDAAQRMVNILRMKKADLIIAVTDIGDDRDKYLAQHINGIDLIIGGFLGRGIDKPFENPTTHTIVFRTYGNMGNIALINIFYDKEKESIVKYEAVSKTLFDYEFPISDSIIDVYEFKKINEKWISE
jgi:5'-nucleotidase